jgi:hypothetical protein
MGSRGSSSTSFDTFVVLWVAAGANVKEVSVRAGHSSVTFTLDRYDHLSEDQ